MFHEILLPILSMGVVIVIFIVTRARQQGDSSLMTSAQVNNMLKEREARREEERDRDKDLRNDMRHINESINNLTNSINLHTHMFSENKDMINTLRSEVNEIKNRLYVIELKMGRNGFDKPGKSAV